MDAQDYRMEAALYFAKGAAKQALTFRRFGHAADAIRFAVEELPPKLLGSCSLEVNGNYFFGRQIKPLYDSDEYPLQRGAKKR